MLPWHPPKWVQITKPIITLKECTVKTITAVFVGREACIFFFPAGERIHYIPFATWKSSRISLIFKPYCHGPSFLPLCVCCKRWVESKLPVVPLEKIFCTVHAILLGMPLAQNPQKLELWDGQCNSCCSYHCNLYFSTNRIGAVWPKLSYTFGLNGKTEYTYFDINK